VLLQEEPDVLAFETIPDKIECTAIVLLLQELDHLDVGTWISFACKDSLHLNDGTPLPEILDLVDYLDQKKRVSAVGINCCSCTHVVELAKLLASHVEKSNNKRSIVIYPNSGEQWDAAAQSWIPGTGCTNPKDFAHLIQKAIHSIDNQTNLIVGGCCRTSTDTIATLRKLL